MFRRHFYEKGLFRKFSRFAHTQVAYRVSIKRGGFFSQKVGFTNEKNESLWKIDRKITKNSENRSTIAKSGWISTSFVQNLTKHQARAYSGREALNRGHREAFRGKSQVGGNPENPGFYPALAITELIIEA